MSVVLTDLEAQVRCLQTFNGVSALDTHTHAHTNKDKQASSECQHSGLLSSLSRKALYELSLLRSYTTKGSNAIRNRVCI